MVHGIAGGGVCSSPVSRCHSSLTYTQAAGLCLASRLSEDPNISVLVLEAGSDRFDDPKLRALYVVDISEREPYLWC